MTIVKLLQSLKDQRNQIDAAIHYIESVLDANGVEGKRVAILKTARRRKYHLVKKFVMTRARKKHLKDIQRKKRKFKMTPKRLAHLKRMREIWNEKRAKAKLA